MLLKDFIHKSISELETIYPSPEARGLVLNLCSSKLGTESYTHIIEPNTLIPDSQIESLQNAMIRLCSGEPLQYILGYSEFRGRKFKVNPSVLIPRPETEQLVDCVLEALPHSGKVLDLCTGSGCIAWSVALERPDSEVVAIDISKEALFVAKNQFPDNNSPTFIEADLLSPSSLQTILSAYPEGFDVIVSNPPYIMESEKSLMRKNVLDFEPDLALFVSNEEPLIFYEAIALWSQSLLKLSGKGFVELNDLLIDDTEDLFKKANFPKTSKIQDFFSRNRFLSFNR